MKGWVYVISNKAMPDLIKVGYSMKDPAQRAVELNHTGSPHPYIVDYEVLVDSPYHIEQTVHRKLSQVREGKEWFRCSAENAIVAIREVSANKIHLENFKRADREKADSIRNEKELAKKAQIECEMRQVKEKERVEAHSAKIIQTKQIHDQKVAILIEKYKSRFKFVHLITALVWLILFFVPPNYALKVSVWINGFFVIFWMLSMFFHEDEDFLAKKYLSKDQDYNILLSQLDKDLEDLSKQYSNHTML